MTRRASEILQAMIPPAAPGGRRRHQEYVVQFMMGLDHREYAELCQRFHAHGANLQRAVLGFQYERAERIAEAGAGKEQGDGPQNG
jgi:hypothetical protein